MALEFEWDGAKAEENLTRHGVSFGEAQSVFADPLALELPDPAHSDQEDRWIAVGRSYRGRLLVVIFTERGDAIRIITARVASSSEARRHEGQ